MPARYLIDIHRFPGHRGMGTKAEMLGLLHRYGLSVPPALCCTIEAWQRYRLNDPELLPSLRSELSRLVRPCHFLCRPFLRQRRGSHGELLRRAVHHCP